jgi:hypothetical protein
MRYRSGLSSYLDLLDAQRSFTAQLTPAQVEGHQATAAVTLYPGARGRVAGGPGGFGCAALAGSPIGGATAC